MFEKISAIGASIIISIGGFFGLVPESEPVHVDEIMELQSIVQSLQSQLGEQEESFGAFSPAAGNTYRLKSSIGTTNTTINLSSFKEPISDLVITMDSLASDIGYGTLDPQSTTRKEFISFTGITQNADGSAQLTGVTRGLGFTSPFTASSTLRKSHPGQSIFILSDSPQFFNEYARRRSDETITGSWSIPTPTAATNPATKAYVDSVVTGGAITNDGIAMGAIAGETFATGTVVFFDDQQDEWMKASALVAASSTNVQLGVAQGAGTNGNAIDGGVLTQGLDSTQIGGTAGDTIYLSDTEGATSTSAGTISVVLGEMKSATEFYFDPVFGNYAGGALDNTFTGSNTFSTTTTFSGSVVYASSTTVRVYTSDDTWTKPANLSYIQVEVVGGGGEGGEGGSSDGGGGGGGGGYAREILTADDLSATTSVSITVGAGGSGDGESGGSGGTSRFSGLLSATGGAGGAGATDPDGGAGGVGSGGDLNATGGGGGVGLENGQSNGAGGSSYFGGGAPATDAAAGVAGSSYGGGGSGGYNSLDAGNGAAGVVIVTEYFN